MPSYKILKATLDEIVIPGLGDPNAKPPRKFFLLVNGEDRNKYQVKLNEVNQRHNINEFIAHYMGSCCEIPLLDAAFVYFDDKELKIVKEKIEMATKEYQLSLVDIDMMKQKTFFAVKWERNITRIIGQADLTKRVSEATNKNAFFSLYSFDQTLKNADRHPGNHLVVKRGSARYYHLIDFDRLFFHTNWSMLRPLMSDFSPIAAARWHEHLMRIPRTETMPHVHYYAGRIRSISDRDIQTMCDTILDLYDVSADEVGLIKYWMTSRKSEIVDKCLENEKYFPNVAQRSLFSAG